MHITNKGERERGREGEREGGKEGERREGGREGVYMHLETSSLDT